MKRAVVLVVAVVLLLSFSSLVSAVRFHNNLILDRIVVIPDEQLIVRISIDDDLGEDFVNGKVVVTIPELGVRAARNTEETDSADTITVLADIPENVHGDYYVRIVVQNDDVRRIRHRIITI